MTGLRTSWDGRRSLPDELLARGAPPVGGRAPRAGRRHSDLGQSRRQLGGQLRRARRFGGSTAAMSDKSHALVVPSSVPVHRRVGGPHPGARSGTPPLRARGGRQGLSPDEAFNKLRRQLAVSEGNCMTLLLRSWRQPLTQSQSTPESSTPPVPANSQQKTAL